MKSLDRDYEMDNFPAWKIDDFPACEADDFHAVEEMLSKKGSNKMNKKDSSDTPFARHDKYKRKDLIVNKRIREKRMGAEDVRSKIALLMVKDMEEVVIKKN